MSKRNLIILALILVAIFSRFLPHPPNFTAIGAVALFGGAWFSNKKLGLILPLSALLLSDIVMELSWPGMGFHKTMIFVYGAFIIAVMLGWALRKHRKAPVRILGTTLSASILFFTLTNFGVWLTSGMYTMDITGLITCFGAAIPFFHYSVLGDLLYSGIFFGTAYFISARYPRVLATEKA